MGCAHPTTQLCDVQAGNIMHVCGCVNVGCYMFNEHCSSVYEIHTKHMKFAYECCCLVSHPNLTCLRHFEGWFYNEKKRERNSKKERNSKRKK